MSDYIDLRVQVANLAYFIMDEIPGEPSGNESAVETAIRIMRSQRTVIESRRTREDNLIMENDHLREQIAKLRECLAAALGT